MKRKILITLNGETHNLRAWCKLYNANYHRIYRRLLKGESFEQALQFPGYQPMKITLAGQTRTRSSWLRKVGVNSSTWYCRQKRGWSDEQMLRPKTEYLYEAFGRKQTLKQWCAEHQKKFKTVHHRMRDGMSLELALTLAVGKYKRRKTKEKNNDRQTDFSRAAD